MKRKILQYMANFIITVCDNAPNDEIFDYYYNLGCLLDAYSVEFHGIYLN